MSEPFGSILYLLLFHMLNTLTTYNYAVDTKEKFERDQLITITTVVHDWCMIENCARIKVHV